MSRKLFSIILPIYNVEKYLEACIESILTQTFQDFELILVDDGSTDSSPAMCDRYVSKYENVTAKHFENAGLSEARNRGYDLATGEYIFFIDSDDYLIDNSVLEKIASTIEKANRPDEVVFKSIKWFESDGSLGSCQLDFKIARPDVDFVDVCLQLCDKSSFENQAWTRVVKRSMLEDAGIQFHKGLISEDIDWHYQVVLHAKSIALIDEPLYVYRQRTGSISQSGNTRSMESVLWILNKWSKEMADTPDAAYTIIKNDLARIYCNALILMCSIDGGEAYYEKLRGYARLMNVGNNSRVKKFRLMKRLFGFRGLTKLIKLALWIKKRR